MNEINSRSKTIILHNVKDIIHDDKKSVYIPIVYIPIGI